MQLSKLDITCVLAEHYANDDNMSAVELNAKRLMHLGTEAQEAINDDTHYLRKTMTVEQLKNSLAHIQCQLSLCNKSKQIVINYN